MSPYVRIGYHRKLIFMGASPPSSYGYAPP